MPFLVCEQWRPDRSLFLVGIHGQHKRKTQRKLDTHFLNVRPYGRTVPTRNLIYILKTKIYNLILDKSKEAKKS